MPTSLRVILRSSAASVRRSRRNLAATSCSALARSALGSMLANVAEITSSSTPFVRSSAANARLPFPALTRRERTHCSAKSSSSIRPTCVRRSRTSPLTSSG
jgi:hypothetical protein